MPKKYPLSELELKAWEFAKEAHKGVNRKFSGVPYFEHVRKVFILVKKVDKREIMGAASLLHDTVEDVEWITYDVIKKEFGKEVADIVKELTSKDNVLQLMGKQNYLLNKMIHMSNDALIIKLCDRLQNLSDHFSSSDKFRRKYYLETKYIMDSLIVNRNLNRPQLTVYNQIVAILEMMSRRYKILSFESFQY